MAFRRAFSPTLDGGLVAIGDGAVRRQTLRIESGEYTPPIWLRTEAGLVIPVAELPFRAVLDAGQLEVLSEEPVFIVDAPTLSAFVSGSTLTLTTSAYSSNEPSSEHLSTRWQITDAEDTAFADPFYDEVDAVNLTELVLEDFPEGDYLARALHRGGGSFLDETDSDWSEADEFAVSGEEEEGEILFHSDWSTELGTSDNAVRDMGKALPWSARKDGSSGGTSVVTAASTGRTWPSGMANVLRIDCLASSSPTQGVRNTDRFPIVQVGETISWRVYLCNETPNSYSPGGSGDETTHGWQDGLAGGGITRNWTLRVINDQNGLWTLELFITGDDAVLGGGSAIQSWNPPARLTRGVVYGIEVTMEAVSPTTWIPRCRIYSAAGALLYGPGDFSRGNGNGDTLAEDHEFVMANGNFAGTNDLQLGSNGWSADPAEDFVAFYYGGQAICLNGLCGPYSGGI